MPRYLQLTLNCDRVSKGVAWICICVRICVKYGSFGDTWLTRVSATLYCICHFYMFNFWSLRSARYSASCAACTIARKCQPIYWSVGGRRGFSGGLAIACAAQCRLRVVDSGNLHSCEMRPAKQERMFLCYLHFGLSQADRRNHENEQLDAQISELLASNLEDFN